MKYPPSFRGLLTASMLLASLLGPHALWAEQDSLLIRGHFINRPLVEVFNELSATYDLHFAYDPASVEDVTVSAHLPGQSVQEAMTLLLGHTQLEFRLLTPWQIVIRPGPSKEPKQGSAPMPRQHVKGYVRDAHTGLPLPFANVLVVGTQQGVVGRQDGRFSLSLPRQSQPIELNVSYLGFEAQRIRWIPSAEPLLVELKPAQASTTPPVEIRDRPSLMSEQGISQLRLSARRLSSLPSMGEQDLLHALKYLPGVNGLNETSVGLSVRGGSAEENLLTLDGMTLYKVDHFWGIFSVFNSEAIEQMKVYKSDFPLKYGGRTSSIIELEGRAARSDRWHASAGVNLLSAQLQLEVPFTPKLSLMLAGRRSYTDVLESQLYQQLFAFASEQEENDIGLEPVRTPDTTQRLANPLGTRSPSYYFYDLHAKLRFQPRKGSRWDLNYFQGGDVLDFSVERAFEYPRRRITQRVEEQTVNLNKWTNQGISAQWQTSWDEAWETTATLAYSTYEETETLDTDIERTSPDTLTSVNRSLFREENSIHDLRLQGDVRWQPSEQHAWQAGGEVQQLETFYDLVVNQRTSPRRAQLATSYMLYLGHDYRPTSALHLKAGLRATRYSPTATNYLSPRASLRYEPARGVHLKAAWGVYYQFAREIYRLNQLGDLDTFWGLAEAPSLPVGRATHWVLGAGYQTETFQVDVEAYQKDLSGLTTYSTLAFSPERVRRIERQIPDYRFYQGTGLIQGLDLLLKQRLGDYTGWLAYTLGKVTHRYQGLNRGMAFPAEEDQRHQLKWVNLLQVGAWDLSLTYVYGSGRAFTDLGVLFLENDEEPSPENVALQTERLPAYHRVDLGATRRLHLGPSLQVEVGASIYNLLNRQNIQYRQYLYAFGQSTGTGPPLRTSIVGDDAQLLGFTPNVFFRISF